MIVKRPKNTKTNGECPVCGNPLTVSSSAGSLCRHCGICGWEGSTVTASGLSDLEDDYEE